MQYIIIIELSLHIYTASNIDYEHFTMDATLTSTVSRLCGIIVRTEMDLIYENFEVFSVSLSDASANPMIRLGANKIIRIIDGQSKSEITDFLSIALALTGALVSLLETTIVQDEGDGDVLVCVRLDSPEGGAEREIFITLNSSELIP